VRAFRLSRLPTEPENAGEGASPPEGFHAIDHVEAGSWVASGDDHGTVAFSPAAAVLAEGSFPGATRKEERDDGWIVLEIPAADEGALAAMVLQYGPDAEALGPVSLRDDVIRRAEAAAGA
jgi:proteasome accessory factor B